MTAGISCAGVFQSTDAGNTWYPTNTGLEAFFLPNSSIEVGHDPHSMIRHPKHPNVIWQQNHWWYLQKHRQWKFLGKCI